MILDSMTMLGILIALSTSIAVIALAIRQNAILTKENIKLRRALRLARTASHVYYDPDIAQEDVWTTR